MGINCPLGWNPDPEVDMNALEITKYTSATSQLSSKQIRCLLTYSLLDLTPANLNEVYNAITMDIS